MSANSKTRFPLCAFALTMPVSLTHGLQNRLMPSGPLFCSTSEVNLARSELCATVKPPLFQHNMLSYFPQETLKRPTYSPRELSQIAIAQNVAIAQLRTHNQLMVVPEFLSNYKKIRFCGTWQIYVVNLARWALWVVQACTSIPYTAETN